MAKATNNGKKGGWLKGKPHYDKNGKPLGGIKAVVSDTGQPVELEGGEVIINKEASKKHWRELSRINQSAGGGVPILPPDKAVADVDEYRRGGNTIDFNPNVVPVKWVYDYAKRLKTQYPKVWALGGNHFSEEAFNNLERVVKRGHWLDSEEWFYGKWLLVKKRHSKDTKLADVIDNLKWLNKVNKGWEYMRGLIEAQIKKHYPMAKTGWKHKELAKGIKTEREHAGTLKKVYQHKLTPKQALKSVAKDHLKEDKKYYTKLAKMEKKFSDGGGVSTTYNGTVWTEGDVVSIGKKKIRDVVITRITDTGWIYYTGTDGSKGDRFKFADFAKMYNKTISSGAKPTETKPEVKKPATKTEPEPKKPTPKATSTELPNEFMFATPTGEKSRLTYLQQTLVRTLAFKDFFGDWEASAVKYKATQNWGESYKGVSQVIDRVTLEPRLMYHGTMTDKEFFVFEANRNDKGRPYAYFAVNKEYAENFTTSSQRGTGENPFMYQCFLNVKTPFMAIGTEFEMLRRGADHWLEKITEVLLWDKHYTTKKKNPAEFDAVYKTVFSQIGRWAMDMFEGGEYPFWTLMANDKKSTFKYFLVSHGYDGIMYGEEYKREGYDPNNPAEYTMATTIFDSTQAKLGDGRNLDFDKLNPDVRFEDGGNVAGETKTHLTKKDEVGKLLFGEKYPVEYKQTGGTLEPAPQISEDRAYVEDLIAKMKA